MRLTRVNIVLYQMMAPQNQTNSAAVLLFKNVKHSRQLFNESIHESIISTRKIVTDKFIHSVTVFHEHKCVSMCISLGYQGYHYYYQ